LSWSTNQIIALKVDRDAGLFTFTNETTNLSITFALNQKFLDDPGEWRFTLFIWGSYKYKLLGYEKLSVNQINEGDNILLSRKSSIQPIRRQESLNSSRSLRINVEHNEPEQEKEVDWTIWKNVAHLKPSWKVPISIYVQSTL